MCVLYACIERMRVRFVCLPVWPCWWQDVKGVMAELERAKQSIEETQQRRIQVSVFVTSIASHSVSARRCLNRNRGCGVILRLASGLLCL